MGHRAGFLSLLHETMGLEAKKIVWVLYITHMSLKTVRSPAILVVDFWVYSVGTDL